MFKRKALEKLKYWKEKKAPKYSVLLEGARRVGKSTIAEEFAKQIEHALKKITGNDDESRASLDKVIDDLNTEISKIDSVYESEKMKRFRANPQLELSEATKDVGPY